LKTVEKMVRKTGIIHGENVTRTFKLVKARNRYHCDHSKLLITTGTYYATHPRFPGTGRVCLSCVDFDGE